MKKTIKFFATGLISAAVIYGVYYESKRGGREVTQQIIQKVEQEAYEQKLLVMLGVCFEEAKQIATTENEKTMYGINCTDQFLEYPRPWEKQAK